MLKPLLTLALLLPAITHARIGETPEQCAKRYGEPFESLGGEHSGLRSFTKGGILTTCYFSEGKCAALSFEVIVPSRTEYEVPVNPAPVFTKDQMAQLINANKGDSEWDISTKGGDVFLFTAKDGSRRAISTETQIIIQTTANLESRKKLVGAEAIEAAIKDF